MPPPSCSSSLFVLSCCALFLDMQFFSLQHMSAFFASPARESLPVEEAALLASGVAEEVEGVEEEEEAMDIETARDTEEDPAAAADLAALLVQFEGAELVADRAALQSDALQAAMVQLLDRCQQLLNAQAAGTTGPLMSDFRAHVVAAMDTVSLSAATLTSTVHRHTANMAHVMSNVVCNHLARGPADAPFFVTGPGPQPHGVADLWLNADNPTLPPGSYPSVPRIEARTVQLF